MPQQPHQLISPIRPRPGKEGSQRLPLLLAATILISLLTPIGSAPGILSATEESCSWVRANDAANTAQVGMASINIDIASLAECNNSASPIITIPAGSSFTVFCNRFTTGATSVLTPTTMTINLVEDNDNFESNTPTSIRTINADSCISGSDSFTAACTTDGNVGSAAAYGIIRIHVRITRTGTGTYDVNSDEGGTPPTAGSVTAQWGIMRCESGLTSLGESNAQTTYAASDTIGTAFQGNATPFQASNNGNAWLKCGPTAYNLGSNFPTSASKSNTAIVIGSLVLWPDDCANIQFGFAFTSFSAVSGYTDERIGLFNGTPPTGTTFNSAPGDNATFTSSKSLDRTITQIGACEYHVNATVASTTDFERLEGVSSHCHSGWQNVRGTALGSNVAMRGYLTRSIPPDVADYTATDFLSGGSGATDFTKVSLITATPGTYHAGVQTFSTTARTDAVLLSIGNVSETYTLTNIRHFTDIQLRKTLAGANESSFTSGDDQLFVSARGLKNIREEILFPVNLTCNRIFPDSTLGDIVPMGNTDSSGNSGFEEFPIQPPLGAYDMHCGSESAGNIAHFTVSYFVVSAFSGNTVVVIETYRDGQTLTIGAGIHTVTEEGLEENSWDDTNDVRYRFMGRQDDGYNFYVISEGFLTQAGATPVWATNVTIPSNTTKYYHIHVWANFTGQTFLGVREVEQNATGGSTNGDFTGTFTGVVNDTSAIPYEIAFPALLVLMSLAGVGVSFASRTNPIPTFVGMIVQIVCWGLTTTYAVDLGATNTQMFTLAFVAVLMLLAMRAYFMLFGGQKAEA